MVRIYFLIPRGPDSQKRNSLSFFFRSRSEKMFVCSPRDFNTHVAVWLSRVDCVEFSFSVRVFALLPSVHFFTFRFSFFLYF